MKATEFKSLLDGLKHDIKDLLDQTKQGYVLGKPDALKLPDYKSPKFDIGQSELLRRLVWDVNYTIEEVDDGCSACVDMVQGTVTRALELIERYQKGELTQPRRVAIVSTYMKKDRSHSQSIMLDFEAGKPRVVSAKSKFTRDMQTALDAQAKKAASLEGLVMPAKVGDYTLEGDGVKFTTLFEEEIPDHAD